MSVLKDSPFFYRNLEVINFGDCLLRSFGFQAIAAAVTSRHQSLKALDLSYNEIKPADIQALLNVLAYGLCKPPSTYR